MSERSSASRSCFRQVAVRVKPLVLRAVGANHAGLHGLKGRHLVAQSWCPAWSGGSSLEGSKALLEKPNRHVCILCGREHQPRGVAAGGTDCCPLLGKRTQECRTHVVHHLHPCVRRRRRRDGGHKRSRTASRTAARNAVQSAGQTSAQASVQTAARTLSARGLARDGSARVRPSRRRLGGPADRLGSRRRTGRTRTRTNSRSAPNGRAATPSSPSPADYQDPMLLIESVRQIGPLLAHAEFGVPFGHQFLMWDMFFSTSPNSFVAEPHPHGGRTAHGLPGHRPQGPGARRYALRRHRVARRKGAGHRGRRVQLPVPPSTAGCAPAGPPPPTASCRRDRPGRGGPLRRPACAARDQMASGSGDRSGTARQHCPAPTFFDHPVDHIPGMVLLEAARQAGLVSTGMPDALLLGLKADSRRSDHRGTGALLIEPQAEPHGTRAAYWCGCAVRSALRPSSPPSSS